MMLVDVAFFVGSFAVVRWFQRHAQLSEKFRDPGLNQGLSPGQEAALLLATLPVSLADLIVAELPHQRAWLERCHASLPAGSESQGERILERFKPELADRSPGQIAAALERIWFPPCQLSPQERISLTLMNLSPQLCQLIFREIAIDSLQEILVAMTALQRPTRENTEAVLRQVGALLQPSVLEPPLAEQLNQRSPGEFVRAFGQLLGREISAARP